MDFNPDTCFQLLQNCLVRVHNHPKTAERLFAARALRASFLKKWLPPDSSPLDKIAKEAFLACNNDCASFVINDDPFTDLGQILGRFRAAMNKTFNCGELQSNVLTFQACLSSGRCGPGSSVGTKRTDFYGKMYESALTYTDEGLYHLYKNNTNSRWYEAESFRADNHPKVCVEGSNSTTVPKDGKTNRMICTEPSLNMFLQLGAGEVIERLLKTAHNIDLSTQPDINKSMAKQGSIDGLFATVDLRNASNTICTTLVRYGLPVEAFRVLDRIRSKKTKIDGKYHTLNMFSSMGNGFTFPLQTLIFATLVRATYELLGITPVAYGVNRNYGVFGDDIVCLASAYDKLTEIMSGCGFAVNGNKSFAVGPFRESCGGDYFRGTDVRGVYLRKICCDQDIYSIFNRLTRWSIKHRVDLSDVLDYLLGLAKFRPVPFDVADTAGFKCPASHLSIKKRTKVGGLFYRASEAVANIRNAIDGTSVNASGLLNAYLGSFVRNSFADRRSHQERKHTESAGDPFEHHTEEHRVTERRLLQVTWKIVRKSTPSWDWIPHVGLNIQDYECLWMTLSYKN